MLKKYLLLEIDEAGFNNIRMSFENYVVLAYLTNRILVIPPPQNFYLLGNKTLNEFFNIDNIKKYIKIINSDEEPINASSTSEYKQFIKNNAKILNIHSDRDVIIWKDKNINNMKLQTCNRNEYFIQDYNDTYLYNGGRFINYHTCLIVYNNKEKEKEVKRMILNAIQYTAIIRDNINKAQLNIHKKFKLHYTDKYYAVHIRRNDFIQYKFVYDVSIDTILQQLHKLIPRGSNVYLLTDEVDMSYFKNFCKFYNVLVYKDISHNINVPSWYIPMIEMGLGVRSHIFVASRLSTFSGYIMIERGYKYNSNIFYTQPPHGKKLIPYEGNKDVYNEQDLHWTATPNACWQRPYKTFWDV